jgi:hypothetical protein
MIVRVARHKKNYTVLANATLRDEQLSYRACGLLAYLLSLPDGTDVSGHRLHRARREGRDAVYSAMRELEAAGYIQRTREQFGRGRLRTVVTVSERPVDNASPCPENPYSVGPAETVKALVAPNTGPPCPDNPDSKTLSTDDQPLGDFVQAELTTTPPLPRDELRSRVRALRQQQKPTEEATA